MEQYTGRRPLPFGPLTLLPLLAAALAVAASLPTWIVGLLFGWLVVGVPWNWRRQRVAALHSLLAFNPRLISAVTPEDMEIELSQLARTKVDGEDTFPPYIHRGPEDDRIRSRLKQHRFVIVAGNRYAGKTRSALEAIRSGRDGKVLLVRRAVQGENPLRKLLSEPWLIPKRSRCFVFVDKLDAYLDGLDPHDIQAWLEARPRAALVATISHKQRQAALNTNSASFDENKQILDENKIALLKDAISGKALAEAEEKYGKDPELARIGFYLGGGRVIETRYVEAESDFKAAWGITTAAILAFRMGLTRGLKPEILVELAKNLSLLDGSTPSDEIEAAIDFCRYEPEGILGMLAIEELPEGELTLRANSVLVRASEAPTPGALGLSLDTWKKVAELLADDQWSCVHMARAAWLKSIAEDPPDRQLMELALELLWSNEARLEQDSEVGRIGVDLAAELIEELERPEGSSRTHQQPFGPPAPLPTPNREKVEEVIDRRGVIGADNIFEPALPAYWNPPPFYSSRSKRNALRFALLVAMDVCSALIGIAAGVWVASQLPAEVESSSDILRGARVAIPLLVVLFAYLGLYRPDSKRAKVAEIVKGMSITAFVVALVALLAGFEPPVLVLIMACGTGASFAIWFARAVYDLGSGKWVRGRELRARTLFVAPVTGAHLTADLIRQTSRRPMQFVGFVSRDEARDPSQLSTLSEFELVLDEFFVDHVILADPELPLKERSRLATICHTKGVRLELFPVPDEIFQEAGEALPDLSVPLIQLPPPYLPWFSARVKLYFDLIVGGLLAIPAFLVFAPLVAFLFCANVWRSPIVRVPRLGRKTVGFSMYRLELRPGNSFAEIVNALLIRTHLDELPQLYNVLRGEMSLVGPRPLDDREFSQLGEVERHRYAVKPGITGLWQVSHRNRPVRDEFARIALMATLDLVYCRRWSPLLDFTILLRTPWAFFRAAEPSREKAADPTVST
jgi:hypothetical protein